MKKLITLLLVFMPLFIYSQNNPAKLYDKENIKNVLTPKEQIEMFNYSKKELNIDSLINETYILFNKYRIYVGVDTLISDSLLEKAATIQSEYCASISKITHENKTPKYSTPQNRLNSFDKNNSVNFNGEISCQRTLFYSFLKKRTISESILDSFYNSISHRKILEKNNSKKIGISINKKGHYLYVVVIFGY